MVALAKMVTSTGFNLGNQVLGDPFFVHNVVAFSKRNQTVGITGMNNKVIIEFGPGHSVWTGFAGVGVLTILIILALVKESYYEPGKSVDQRPLKINQELGAFESETLNAKEETDPSQKQEQEQEQGEYKSPC